jgi:hypothetical protein
VSKYFVNLDNEVHGPMSVSDIASLIRKKKLMLDGQVKLQGSKSWVDALSVQEIMDAISSVEVLEEFSEEKPKKVKKNSQNFTMMSLVKWLLVCCGVLFLSCCFLGMIVKNSQGTKQDSQGESKQGSEKLQVSMGQHVAIDAENFILFESCYCADSYPLTFYNRGLIGNQFSKKQYGGTVIVYYLVNKSNGKIWNFQGFKKVSDMVDEHNNSFNCYCNQLQFYDLVLERNTSYLDIDKGLERVDPQTAKARCLVFSPLPKTSENFKVTLSLKEFAKEIELSGTKNFPKRAVN